MISKRSNTASAKGRDIAPGVPAQKGSVMEDIEDGRVASDRAGGADAPEPRAASQPVGAHPSRVGFTGSQHGIQFSAQRLSLLMTLAQLRVRGARWMHNGDCVGSDEIAGRMWRALDGQLWLHPPTVETKRAFLTCDFASDRLPYLQRNHVIVNLSEALVATPAEMFEQQRSGTWATIRYAAKMRRPITIIWPNGSVEHRHPSDSDGSGEASETRSGSTVGDSAGPKDIAQGESA